MMPGLPPGPSAAATQPVRLDESDHSTPSEAAAAVVVRHRCFGCGAELKSARRGRRFCSDACRAAAYRRRTQGLPEDAPRQPRSRERGRLRLSTILAQR